MSLQATIPEDPDIRRRRFLVSATTVIGTVGLATLAVPFISAMNPGGKVRSAGAPTWIDISKLEPGQQITVNWRGKPVWILRRSRTMLEALNTETNRARLRDPDSLVGSQQPEYAQNSMRAIRPEYLVLIALCTHLGCVPSFRPDVAPADLGANWPGGYFCPCHGSMFDLAGRVYKAVPAPANLVIPPYRFLSDSEILVGEDSLAHS